MQKSKLKNILLLILCIILLISSAMIITHKKVTILSFLDQLAPFNNTIVAKQYAAVEVDTEQFIFAYNTHERTYPASIMKLFTVYHSHISLPNEKDKTLIIPDSILKDTPTSASIAGLEQKPYTLRDLQISTIVASGYDAINGLQYTMAAKSKDTNFLSNKFYTDNINTALKKAGLKDTLIDNAAGFSKTSYTTINDTNTIVNYLLKNTPLLNNKEFTLKLSNGQTIKNTCEFTDPNSKWYNPNIKNIKTGTADDSFHLVSLYTSSKGADYLIYVFNTPTNDNRYRDTLKIINRIEKEIK